MIGLQRHFGLLALCLCVGWPAASFAGDMHLELQTLGLWTRDLRPSAFDQTEQRVPTFQVLRFSGQELGGTGFFAAGNAYLGQQWGDESVRESRMGDVAFGYLGWKNATRSLQFKLGRIHIFGGVASAVMLDGAVATAWLPGDVRLDAWGGMAGRAGLDNAFEAPAYGGRLAWMPWELGHLGLSFQNVEEKAGVAQRSLGGDFSLRAIDKLLVTGAGAFDLVLGRLQEARVDASYRLTSYLDVNLRSEMRDPTAWLSRTSIFTAFVNRQDTAVGGGLQLRTPGALAVSAGYERFVVGDGFADGDRAHLEFKLRPVDGVPHSGGLRLTRATGAGEGYLRARLYGTWRPSGKLSVSAAGDAFVLDKPIHGDDTSIMGTLAGRYDLVDGATLGLDGQLWRNPYFDKQGLLMFSLRLTDALWQSKAPVAAPAAAFLDAATGQHSAAIDTAGLWGGER